MRVTEGRRRRAGAGHPPRPGARRGHRPPGPLPHLPGARGAPDVRRRRTALPPAGRRATRRLRDAGDGQAGPGPAGATAATTGRCGGRGRRRDRPRVRLRWLGRRYGHRGSVGSLLAEFAAPPGSEHGLLAASPLAPGHRSVGRIFAIPDLRAGSTCRSTSAGTGQEPTPRPGTGPDPTSRPETSPRPQARATDTRRPERSAADWSVRTARRSTSGSSPSTTPAGVTGEPPCVSTRPRCPVPGCWPRTAPSWPRPTSTHGNDQ